MGTVYLCEHAVLHRRFAVKVLRSDLSSDAELVDRFRNEAIAASRIGQENVVDVVDFGAEEDGALYYVMEALDGRSLGSVIRDQGPLPVGRALDLLEQICRALAAAHASGVVHRDVKPDNVFLVRRDDGAEQVKVIDFGISQVPPAAGSARITRAGAIIGTPEYMAPEQATGHVIDHRADVYAAGVLAFEMLTGQLPIEADTPIATLVAHQTKEPDPPSRRAPGIPPEVDALVLRALAKRPEDRFESMEALAVEVARIRARLASAPPASTLAARLEAAARPSLPRGETVALPDSRGEVRRRSAVVRWAMVLAVAAAAAAVAIVAWGMREERAVPSTADDAGAIAAPRPVSMPANDARRARPPTPTPTATSTATPTATAAAPDAREETVAPPPRGAAGLATEWEKPRPAPPLPELVLEPPRTPREPPRPQRSESPPRPKRERRASDAELHDPYGGGELKDPFR